MYKRDVYTTLQSAKCAVALCVKKKKKKGGNLIKKKNVHCHLSLQEVVKCLLVGGEKHSKNHQNVTQR